MEKQMDQTIFYCIIIELSDGHLIGECNFCYDKGGYDALLNACKCIGKIKTEIKFNSEQLKELDSRVIDSMISVTRKLVAHINVYLAIREKIEGETTLRRCAN